MVDLVLADVLEIESLKSARLLAGEDKLDRPVTGVTVGEVPDIGKWLTGGELVLSTFFAVSRDPRAAQAFASKIIGGPAAALAVKPERFLESIPAEVVELARKKSFPLIEVPASTRWTTIIADIYAEIAAREVALEDACGDELLRAAIEGRGLKSIARAASEKLKAPVAVLDLLDGAVVEGRTPAPFPEEAIDLLKSDERVVGVVELDLGGGSCDVERIATTGGFLYVAPVVIASETAALVATTVPGELEEGSISVLKKAAEASAVEMARRKAIEEAEARVRGDFLDDLIAGRVPLEQISARISKLGGNLSRGYALLCCSFEPGESFGRFRREVSRLVAAEAKGSLIAERDDGLIVLLSFAEDTIREGRAVSAGRFARKIAAIAAAVGGKASVGIGRFRVDPGDIVKSLDEAKIALDVGRRLSGSGSITDFDQVGIYRLLLPLAREAEEEGRLYFEETIGRLAEYDRSHGTELVATLESFRRNDENVALAAEELFAHRHTVRYRLQRIAEITGCDPFKAADREKLYMGLYVKNILGL